MVISSREGASLKPGWVIFFEKANSAHGVKDFFRNLHAHYGGLTPQFWKDFMHSQLHEEVGHALLAAGGHDSLGLANNLTEWLADTYDRKTDGTTKNVSLGISHGESIHAFLYHLSHFLEWKELADNETLLSFRNFDPGYNEGIDIHVSPEDHVTVVLADKHAAAFTLDDYRKFIAGKKNKPLA